MENETTKKKLVTAIDVLADKIRSDVKADDALKYTQAALNASQVIQIMKGI